MHGQDERQEGQGIGGWLAVFIASYAAGTLIRAVARAWLRFPALGSQSNPLSWLLLHPMSWLPILCQTAIGLGVVWCLVRHRHPSSVVLTIAALWLAKPLDILLDVVEMAGITPSVPLATLLQSAARVDANLILTILYSAGWTAYFLRSTRVANIYYRADRSRTLATTFD